MKKVWMIFFSMPILTFATYPIYNDDVAPTQPEPLVRESHSLETDLIKEKHSGKESECLSCEEGASQKSIQKQGLKDSSIVQDQKEAKSVVKAEPSSTEKNQSSISKREPVKRSSTLQNNSSRSKHRQNPNRPHVIQRDGQEKSKNLPKIEAAAEEVEEGLSTHQNEEWIGLEDSSPKDATAQENELSEHTPEAVDKSHKDNRSTNRKHRTSRPGKRLIDK